jgi:hypothetical protein
MAWSQLVAAEPFDALIIVTTFTFDGDNVVSVGVVGMDLTSGTLVAMSRFFGGDCVSSTVRWQPRLLSSADIRVMTGYPDT